jgi:hypothetical protein
MQLNSGIVANPCVFRTFSEEGIVSGAMSNSGAVHTKPRGSPTPVLGEVDFSNQLDTQMTADSVCRAR